MYSSRVGEKEPKPYKPYDPRKDDGNAFFGVLSDLIKKTPLFSIILILGIILAVTGFIGKKTFLKRFNSVDNIKEPFFSISLLGIKDKLNGEEIVIVPTSMQKENPEEKAFSKNPAALRKADNKAAEELNKEGSAKEASGHVIEEAPGETSGQATIEFSRIPKSSSNPVCPAKDYGVADRSLLVDDNYVFNTDTEGDFVPNGTFNKLKKVKNDSYFSDALIIGDSRTVGLYMFSDLRGKANFFCRESTSTFNIPTRKLNYHGANGEDESTTIDQVLSNHKYKKIYISLGINEMGSNVVSYYKHYKSLVEMIRKAQPDAYVFIEGSLHVGQLKSSSDGVYNNTSLVQRNKAISELANGRDIFYIDPNPALCDSNGDLIADYTSDQIHLKADCYKIWADWLRKYAFY